MCTFSALTVKFNYEGEHDVWMNLLLMLINVRRLLRFFRFFYSHPVKTICINLRLIAGKLCGSWHTMKSQPTNCHWRSQSSAAKHIYSLIEPTQTQRSTRSTHKHLHSGCANGTSYNVIIWLEYKPFSLLTWNVTTSSINLYMTLMFCFLLPQFLIVFPSHSIRNRNNHSTSAA